MNTSGILTSAELFTDPPQFLIPVNSLKLGKETEAFKEEITARIERGDKLIVIDLTEAKIDSAGVGQLVAAFYSTRDAEVSLKIVGRPRGGKFYVFESTHLDKVLPLFETLEEALAA